MATPRADQRWPTAVVTVAVAAGAGAGLWRTREPGALDSIWAEDGQNFLTDALNRPWYEAVFTPFNGYFHVVARLCWAGIALFPVGWAAALNATAAAVLTSALAVAVYAAARSRLPCAAAVVIGAGAAFPPGFVPNALAQLQFPLVYAGLWMLLWRRTSGLTIAVPALAVLNSMLGVLLLPVAGAGLLRYRTRAWLLKLVGLLPGAALQLVPLLTGATRRGLGERPEHDPVAVAALYLRWGVPRAFLGPAWLAAPHDDVAAHRALVAAGLLIPAVLAVLAGLAGRAGGSGPEIRLAAVLAGFGALAGAVQLAAHGGAEDRYLVLVGLPTAAAGVCLAVAAGRSGCHSGRLPLVILATLLAVAGAANLRAPGPRDGIPRWGATVAQARAECQVQPGLRRVTVHIAQWPELGWQAVLPCSRLR